MVETPLYFIVENQTAHIQMGRDLLLPHSGGINIHIYILDS